MSMTNLFDVKTCCRDQGSDRTAMGLFHAWFVSYSIVQAKLAAKKRWLAIHDTVESSSPTCYAGEFESLNQSPIFTQSLGEAISQAALEVLASDAQIDIKCLNLEQGQHLQTMADLFPNALSKSELGPVPETWQVVKIQELIKQLNDSSAERHNKLARFSASVIKPLIVFNAESGLVCLKCEDFNATPFDLVMAAKALPTLWVYYALQSVQEGCQTWQELLDKDIVVPPYTIAQNYVDVISIDEHKRVI